MSGKTAPPAAGGSAEAYVRLAARLTEAGDLQGAINALELAVALRPDHPAAHFNLALARLKAGQTVRAIEGFRQAIALKPDFSHAHFQLGIALIQVGQDVPALTAFRRAVTLAPDMGTAWEQIARLLQARAEENGAATAYRAAAAASQRATERQLNEARALIAERRTDEAEETLRQIIALDPGHSLAHWQLAHLLDELGRFSEAEELHRKVIVLDPYQVNAYHKILQNRKATEADRPLLAIMRRLIADGRLTAQQRMQLLFAIGKALEDLRDFAGAMRHFDEANALRQTLSPFDREQITMAFDWLIDTFSADFLARNADLGVADDRAVLILGMPRSGTTLTEQIISSHPLVAAGDELAFWPLEAGRLVSRPFIERIRTAAPELAAGYGAALSRVGPGMARVTDKNPYNFLWIGLIRTIFPNARIVHCRRHPVDTCLSMYATIFGTGSNQPSTRADLVIFYRWYLRLMEHWRSVLPPGDFLEIGYEDLIADPETWSRTLIAHCGLPWDDACLRPEANQRSVRTASVWQARQPIYRTSVERWRNYEPWLGELRELLF